MSICPPSLLGFFPNYILREDLALRPNQRLVLVHPSQGFIPFTVQARTPFYLVYERIFATAGITTLGNNATVDGIQLFDSINRDVLEIKTRALLYHLFVGMSPPSLKLFFEYPKGTVQRVPDNQNFSPTARFSFVDGWNSPFEDPSPAGEIVLPWGRNTTGWRFHNPTTLALTRPLLKFVGYTYRVNVIRNVDLVQSILEERPGAAARKITLGGLTTFPYDPREPYDADWIPFDFGREDIRGALSTRSPTFAG